MDLVGQQIGGYSLWTWLGSVQLAFHSLKKTRYLPVKKYKILKQFRV